MAKQSDVGKLDFKIRDKAGDEKEAKRKELFLKDFGSLSPEEQRITLASQLYDLRQQVGELHFTPKVF